MAERAFCIPKNTHTDRRSKRSSKQKRTASCIMTERNILPTDPRASFESEEMSTTEAHVRKPVLFRKSVGHDDTETQLTASIILDDGTALHPWQTIGISRSRIKPTHSLSDLLHRNRVQTSHRQACISTAVPSPGTDVRSSAAMYQRPQLVVWWPPSTTRFQCASAANFESSSGIAFKLTADDDKDPDQGVSVDSEILFISETKLEGRH